MTLAIIGHGAFGRQLQHLAGQIHRDITHTICFDDLGSAKGGSGIFPFAHYIRDDHAECAFVIGLGYKHLARRREIIRQLLDAGRRVLSLVHPSSFIDHSASMAPGCVVYPMCNVDGGVVMEAGVILNNSCTISHDSRVGESCFLAPGVVLCGSVSIAETCFIGAGAVVTNGVSVAAANFIGASSLVSSDIVMPGGYHVGNPLHTKQKPLRLD